MLPGGSFSTYVAEKVQPGDVLEVLTPVGRFGPRPVADGDPPKSYACVAAGSGITPVLSIVATVLQEQPEARVTLLYVNRTTRNVMFTEELSDLKNRYGPRFQLVHVLSREPRDVELFSGRLAADRLRRLLAAFVPVPALDHVWLCGPFAMINDARETLEDLGVTEDRVHFELFYVDEPPPEVRREGPAVTGETSKVTVVLDGRSSTAPMPRDERILDAAQATRADLPFACKGGVCGTCRARVTEGEVDMVRNYALEPGEVEAGFVLTCQSHPVSAAVTVDFDA
jgi:ring-1,2-phenylacetyl-CoA epoxidase subunit PaaE